MPSFLFSFSKVVFYLCCYSYFSTQNLSDNEKYLKITVLSLGTVESVFVIYHSFVDQHAIGYLTGNPFYSGLLLASAIVLACLMGYESDSISKKWSYFALAIFSAWALWLLQSRSVLIGVIAASIIFIRTPRYKRLLPFFGLAVCGAAIILFPSFLQYMKVNIDDLDLGRFVIWKTSIIALKEHWLFGWGLGNYEAAYMKAQIASPHVLRYEKYTQFAHNDYLQFLVTNGAVGLLMLIGVVIFYFSKKHQKDLPTKNMKWGQSLLLIYAVTSLFNFPFFLPLNGVFFCLTLAILAPLRPSKSSYALQRAYLLLTFVIYLAFNASATHFAKRGDLAQACRFNPLRGDYWRARFDQNPNDKNSIVYLKRSLTLNRQDAFCWIAYAEYLSHIPDSKTEEIDHAFQMAINLAPHHAPFWIKWGLYYSQAKNYPMAKACYKQSINLEPRSSLPFFLLGQTLIDQGGGVKGEKIQATSIIMKERYETIAGSSPYAKFLFLLPSKDPPRVVPLV